MSDDQPPRSAVDERWFSTDLRLVPLILGDGPGEHPPGRDDVVAIYPPLRAVVGGWSGLVGKGWRAGAEGATADGTRMTFRFETSREWFPAPGCGEDLRLHVNMLAQAEADEGRTRRGFRYRAHHDPRLRTHPAQ